MTTGEYRALIRAIATFATGSKGPVVIATNGSEPEVVDETPAELTAQPRTRRRVAAEPKPRRAPGAAIRTCGIETVDELVEFFIAAGKKGIAVNRYKGLGEMNPEQLWATTMDPEIAHAAAGPRRRPRRSRPDVHDAHGRSGRAAAEVHRRQRARCEEPGRVSGSGSGLEALRPARRLATSLARRLARSP